MSPFEVKGYEPCRPVEGDAMSEVLTVDAILFGLLVFSGILGNILVIRVVR